MKTTAGLLLLFALSLHAGEPQIKAELSNRSAFLGDSVSYSIDITYDQGWEFDPIELPEPWGDATVLSQVWSEPQPVEGTNLMRRRLDAGVAWYKLGEYTLPALEITGIPPEGEARIFETDELNIQIINMLEEEDQDMAPSKGQVDLETMDRKTWLIIITIAIVLAVLLVGGLVYWYFSRREREPKPAYVPPPKPPYDEAMERLEQLTHSSLLKEGRYKEFYVEINQIVRHYYARLYGIHAEEMTSFELEDWMADRPELPEGSVDSNRIFQDLCDMVKFAKHEPQESENKQTLNQAYEIVALHRPKPVEGAADVATG